MNRTRIVIISAALLLGFVIALAPFSDNLDKLILSRYFAIVSGSSGLKHDLVVVTVDDKVITENKLWPWNKNWAKYLIAFLMDLKPQKLILGPHFLNALKNPSFLEDFSRNKILVIPLSDNKLSPGIKTTAHLEVKEYKGYYYSFLNYNNKPVLKINPHLNIKRDRFYFLPPKDIPPIFSAQDVALSGFLRGEEFRGIDLEKIKGKTVLLEIQGPGLNSEISFLNAQLRNTIFYLLPGELSIYFGFFLFVLVYILCLRLKYRRDLVVFSGLLVGVILLHWGYFQTHRDYFEITPVVIFASAGFCSAIVEKEIQNKKDRKYKQEMQIARMLKEKEILPIANISSDGVSVSITRYKMDKVGGDFYQFLEFNRGELGIVLGWVPQGGIERVKYIMEVIHGWRDFATVYKEPGKVIQVLNNSLFRFADQGKYATLIYMLFDARKSNLKYVNAGHDPFIILRSTGFVKVIPAEEPTPVGIARDINFQEGEISIYPGDYVIAFSGGISNIIQERGGIKREFLDSLSSYRESRPQEFCNYIFNSLVKIYPQKPEEEWSLLTMKVE